MVGLCASSVIHLRKKEIKRQIKNTLKDLNLEETINHYVIMVLKKNVIS